MSRWCETFKNFLRGNDFGRKRGGTRERLGEGEGKKEGRFGGSLLECHVIWGRFSGVFREFSLQVAPSQELGGSQERCALVFSLCLVFVWEQPVRSVAAAQKQFYFWAQQLEPSVRGPSCSWRSDRLTLKPTAGQAAITGSSHGFMTKIGLKRYLRRNF